MHLLCFSPLSTEAELLLHNLNNEIMHYRSQTYAESTKGTYHTHSDSYLRFCHFAGYDPLPAMTLVICQYAAFLACSMKVSSIKNYLGVIRSLHKEFGLNNPLTDNWSLKSMLLGIK